MTNKKFNDIRKEFSVKENWIELENFQGIMVSKKIGIEKLKVLIEETILHSIYNDNVNEVLLEQFFHIFLLEKCTNITFSIADKAANANVTYNILDNSGILNAVIQTLGEEYIEIRNFLDLEVKKVNNYYTSIVFALEQFTNEAKELLGTLTEQTNNVNNLLDVFDIQKGDIGAVKIPELEESDMDVL